MPITKVNHQGISYNAAAVNVSTAGLAVGDHCYVLFCQSAVNQSIPTPSGWFKVLNTVNHQETVFVKYMAVAGDITGTNNFVVPNGRGVMMALGIRGASPHFLTTFSGAASSGLHATLVDWPALNNVQQLSILIGWASVFDSSGSMFSPTAPLPAGYTDSGVGTLSFGLGSQRSVRLFYQLNVSGTVDPPSTAPSGGVPGDHGYVAGSTKLTTNQGAAILAGDSELSATGLTESFAEAELSGFGNLLAIGEQPLCLFPYIAYMYGGAFFCLENLGPPVPGPNSNVRDICIVRCN